MERKSFSIKNKSLPTFENYVNEEMIGGRDIDDVAMDVYDKLSDEFFDWDNNKLVKGKKTTDAITKILKDIGSPTDKTTVDKITNAVEVGMV